MVPKPINGSLYLPIVAGLGRFLMAQLGKMRVIIGVAQGVLLLAQLPPRLTILNCLPANIAADTLDRTKFSFNQTQTHHSHPILLILLGAASRRLISSRSLKLAPNQEAFCAS